LFGQKSERRLLAPAAQQGSLGQAFDAVPSEAGAAGKKIRIDAHERAGRRTPAHDEGEELGTFFDEAKVPVEVIELPPAGVGQLPADQYEVVSEKVSWRLAQRPGSYVVLKYVRPVVKRRDSGVLLNAPAPAGVIEGSRADVSFIAGMMVDKLVYHLPL
jgi:hypothetical protein